MEIFLTYLFNVAITFAIYVSVFIPFFVLAFVFRRYIPDNYRKITRRIVTTILFLILILSAILPSNIPKNESFDRSATAIETAKIEVVRRNNTEDLQISDQSRQLKMTEEERKSRFDDLVDFRQK
jgi:accessory gene regulator protein AgrB